jgi:hypothetical protein
MNILSWRLRCAKSANARRGSDRRDSMSDRLDSVAVEWGMNVNISRESAHWSTLKQWCDLLQLNELHFQYSDNDYSSSIQFNSFKRTDSFLLRKSSKFEEFLGISRKFCTEQHTIHCSFCSWDTLLWMLELLFSHFHTKFQNFVPSSFFLLNSSLFRN